MNIMDTFSAITNTGDKNAMWIWIIAAIVLAAIILLVISLIVKKVRNSKKPDMKKLKATSKPADETKDTSSNDKKAELKKSTDSSDTWAESACRKTTKKPSNGLPKRQTKEMPTQCTA